MDLIFQYWLCGIRLNSACVQTAPAAFITRQVGMPVYGWWRKYSKVSAKPEKNELKTETQHEL